MHAALTRIRPGQQAALLPRMLASAEATSTGNWSPNPEGAGLCQHRVAQCDDNQASDADVAVSSAAPSDSVSQVVRLFRCW